jgi:hypothetical protein
MNKSKILLNFIEVSFFGLYRMAVFRKQVKVKKKSKTEFLRRNSEDSEFESRSEYRNFSLSRPITRSRTPSHPMI